MASGGLIMNQAGRSAAARRVSGRARIETTSLSVIDSVGARTYLVVSTPVVTGVAGDGQAFSQTMLVTITDARGVSVRRKSATEFESIDGEKYHLVT
jgi:hypothetical protein